MGSISFLPTTGEMIYYLMGQDTFTAASPNIHVLRRKDAAVLPSFTLKSFMDTGGANDFLRTFVGCTANSMNFTLSETSELQCSMDFMAKDVQDEDTAVPTAFTQPTTDGSANSSPIPYMFYDRASNVSVAGTYTDTTGPYTGGRTYARVKGFSFSVNNNLKPMYYTQSSNAQDVFNFLTSNQTYDMSIDLVPSGKLSVDTDAIYDLLEGETRFDVLLPFQRSANDRLDIVAKGCMLGRAPHEYPDDGGEVTVSATIVPEELYCVVRDGIATDYDSL